VVGRAVSNLDQVIEIDKGSLSGIEIGMPVVNQAGLVGKVTQVSARSARVMLVSDARYSVAVKVTSSDQALSDDPTATTPSGLDPQQVVDAATTTTTVPTALVPGITGPDGLPVPATTLPGATPPDPFVDATGRRLTEAEILALAEAFNSTDSVPEESVAADSLREAVTTSTTPTTVPIIEKEYGALEGRGRLRLPQIRFLQDTPSLAELQVGDLVETAGGSESLAPPGIPVGRVLNRANRPGSGGPLLDVGLNADLARLNFVRVVLYKPLSEVGQ
jgi:rod shape-determining protein MreC